MSRKHFQALADNLKNIKPEGKGKDLIQWQRSVVAVANVCSQFNSNFDRGRFYGACGYEY